MFECIIVCIIPFAHRIPLHWSLLESRENFRNDYKQAVFAHITSLPHGHRAATPPHAPRQPLPYGRRAAAAIARHVASTARLPCGEVAAWPPCGGHVSPPRQHGPPARTPARPTRGLPLSASARPSLPLLANVRFGSPEKKKTGKNRHMSFGEGVKSRPPPPL